LRKIENFKELAPQALPKVSSLTADPVRQGLAVVACFGLVVIGYE